MRKSFFSLFSIFIAMVVLASCDNMIDQVEQEVKKNDRPSVPGNVTVGTVTGRSIDISWSASTDYDIGDSVVSYNVYLSTTSESGYTLTGSTTGTGYTYTGLVGNQNYYLIVRAVDTHGAESVKSGEASALTLNNPPPAVTVDVDATTGNSLTLGWGAVTETDNGDNVTNYELLQRRDTETDFTVIATGADLVEYTSTGLIGNTRYYFKVVTTDSLGVTAVSETIEGVTGNNQPGIPGSITVGIVTGDSIEVSWGGATDPDAGDQNLTYNLYLSASSGSGYTLANLTPVAGTSYTFTNLLGNNPYFFMVRAVDHLGLESGDSAEQNARTLNSPPPAATLVVDPDTDITGTSITLRWAAVTETDLGDQILNYKLYSCNSNGTLIQPVITTLTPDLAPFVYTDGFLMGHTTYYYKVVTTDSFGLTTESPLLTATTKNNAPTAPAIASCVPTATTALVTLTPGIDPDGDAITFTVTYWMNASPQVVKTINNVPGAPPVCKLEDLNPGSAFTVQAKAKDSLGAISIGSQGTWTTAGGWTDFGSIGTTLAPLFPQIQVSNNKWYVGYRNGNTVQVFQRTDASAWSNTNGVITPKGMPYYSSLFVYNDIIYISHNLYLYNGEASVLRFYPNQATPSWESVGPEYFTPNASIHTVSVYDGTPYLVHRGGSSGSICVEKFDGRNWVFIGTAGLVPGLTLTDRPAIVFDRGNPIVAGKFDSALRVLKFDGATWIDITGNLGAPYSSIDLCLLEGIPCIAYRSASGVAVWKYAPLSGDIPNWTQVGDVISTEATDNISLVNYNGILHVLYSNTFPVVLTDHLTLKRYINNSWLTVGAEMFAQISTTGGYFDMDIYDGKPYVMYRTTSGPPAVKTIDLWENNASCNNRPSPPSSVSATVIDQVYNDIELTWGSGSDSDTGDTVTSYNVYIGNATGKATNLLGCTTGTSMTAYKLHAGTAYYFVVRSVDNHGAESANSSEVTATTKPWAPVGLVAGSEGLFHTGSGLSNSQMHVYNGTPYVVSLSLSTYKTLSVKKFNGTSWEAVGSTLIDNIVQNDLASFIYDDTIYVAYTSFQIDKDVPKVVSLSLTSPGNWSTVGSEEPCSDCDAQYLTMARYDLGTYLAFMDHRAGSMKVLQNFGTNESWADMLSTSLSSIGNATRLSITAYNNNYYLAFCDPSQGQFVYEFSTLEGEEKWIGLVGTSGQYSTSDTNYLSLHIQSEYRTETSSFIVKPYITYQEGNSRLYVKQFDMIGKTWSSVGTQPVSLDSDLYAATSFSLTGFSGYPYVSFLEQDGGQKFTRIKIFKSGTWSNVGASNTLLSTGATQASLAVFDGTPYISESMVGAGHSHAATLWSELVNRRPYPPNLTVTPDSGSSVLLSWTLNSPVDPDTGNTITGYNIYMTRTTNPPIDPMNKIISLNTGGYSYRITGLDFGINYTFCIKSIDNNGAESTMSSANKKSFTVQLP